MKTILAISIIALTIISVTIPLTSVYAQNHYSFDEFDDYGDNYGNDYGNDYYDDNYDDDNYDDSFDDRNYDDDNYDGDYFTEPDYSPNIWVMGTIIDKFRDPFYSGYDYEIVISYDTAQLSPEIIWVNFLQNDPSYKINDTVILMVKYSYNTDTYEVASGNTDAYKVAGNIASNGKLQFLTSDFIKLE